VSWLELNRQNAGNAASDRGALATQTASSLSSETGVNLDDQLSKMLDLEHSYQASAELISTVKDMYSTLIAALN
jgi:flagellar hook-associated protein 1